MVNIARILLGLLPVLGELPLPLRNQPVFAASINTTHLDFTAVSEACERERTRRRDALREKPRGEQGGECITEDWLHGLGDIDCIWRFR